LILAPDRGDEEGKKTTQVEKTMDHDDDGVDDNGDIDNDEITEIDDQIDDDGVHYSVDSIGFKTTISRVFFKFRRDELGAGLSFDTCIKALCRCGSSRTRTRGRR
jgi:hypothetical protein